MRLLAIDTATEACSAALLWDGQILERFTVVPKGHGTLLLGMMDELLNEAAITLNNLDALAFGCGPGAFTGLRIATAVAQAVGFGADLPLIPISNLAMLAQGLYREQQATRILAALDARMGEIYIGAYTMVAGIAQSVTTEQVTRPETYTLDLEGTWHGVGRGWLDHHNTLTSRLGSQINAVTANLLCRSKDALPIATVAFNEGRFVPPETIVPSYLRNQVAKMAQSLVS